MRLKASLILLALLLAGCAADPGRRWIHASAVVTSLNNTIVDLHELGQINDDTLIDSEPYLKTANTALDKAKTRLVWDGEKYIETGEFNLAMDVLDLAIEELKRKIAEERQP